MGANSCQAVPCGEPQEIPDDATLFRSARHNEDDLEWHADRRAWLPTDRSLQFDPDCSGYWEEDLTDSHGLGPSSVASARRPLVFSGQTHHFRSLDLEVSHTPQASDPIDCAHSSIDWPDHIEPTKPTRRHLRAGMRRGLSLVYGEVSLSPPPGA